MSSCYEAARPGANAGSYQARACDACARTTAVLDVTHYVPALTWPGIGAPATAASWLWSAAAADADQAAEAEDWAPAGPVDAGPGDASPGNPGPGNAGAGDVTRTSPAPEPR